MTGCDGTPLHGAHIFIPSIGRGTATDERGEYIFTNVPAGRHSLVVRHVGCRPIAATIEVHDTGTVIMNLTMTASPIEQEAVVVTGSPHAADAQTTPQEIASISGDTKLRVQKTSLGATLQSLPGIYNMSAGAVAGKPVIRGLTGERVSILSDGVALEYQQYGERHAPTTDPFSYDRIEVIKGASSLLYGSDALGGAVNLVHHPYHFSGEGRTEAEGFLSGAYSSNNGEYMLGVKGSAATRHFAFRMNAVRRQAGNFHSPGILSYARTLQRGDPKFTGEIPWTDFEQTSGALGAGFLSSVGIVSADYDRFTSSNNFLLPDGQPIGISLENQTISLKAVMPSGDWVIKPKFSYQTNDRLATHAGLSRAELPDSADVNLRLNVLTARLEGENRGFLGLSGTVGAEVRHYDHRNYGSVPLQPSGHFTNYALFAFEEWERGRVAVDFGARYDFRTQKFYGTLTNPLLPGDDRRTYSSVSGSVGVAYLLTSELTATAQAGRGFRSPSFFNLYVYGYHGGVFAFQIGNPGLMNESSLDLSSSLRYKTGDLSARISLYSNLIYDYIYLYYSPDNPLAPAPDVAPFVFAHGQADARIAGIDFFFETFVLEHVVVTGTYSIAGGEFLSGVNEGSGLPLMPPDRAVVGAKYMIPATGILRVPYFRIEGKMVWAKYAAGAYEPFAQFDDGYGPDIPFGVCSTAGYALLDAGFGFGIEGFGSTVTFDLTASNLFNAAYRDFLDTYKGYALAPGRSIRVGINVALGT